jgi:integrase
MARKGYKTASFTLPDGTRKYVYAKTQEELDEKVFNLKLQMKMGVDLQDRTTLGELIKLWYTTEVEPNVRENTATNLKCVLNKHLMPMVSEYVAKDVTPAQVKIWLNETGKLNKNAAKICFRALKNAFNLAEENGLVYKSPVLARYKAGGTEYKKREALSATEEQQLIDAVSRTRAHLLVWFLLATGARRGEALGLKWDCVDLVNAEVTLKRNLVFLDHKNTDLRDYMKTEAGTRTVPLPQDLCEALKRERQETNSLFVFHRVDGSCFIAQSFNCFWKKNVSNRFGPEAKQTSRTAGVVTDRVVTPHVLRHTYATRCFEAGMDIKEVQRLMGHASADVTLEVYTHYCEETRKDETFSKARTARSGLHNAAEGAADVPQLYHTKLSKSG